MYSDTHCHLSHIKDRGVDLTALFGDMVRDGFRFVLDIGTKPGDFSRRLEAVSEACARLPDATIPEFFHMSCGIWPDARFIADRVDSVKILSGDIARMLEFARSRSGYAAVGECGLDRYWNGPAAPGRTNSGPQSEDGPGTVDIMGEEELFSMQLELATRTGLAIIVHSREAFDPTVSLIKNASNNRGVIHCWAYGIPEARAFLDLGYSISFPGTVTWGKRESDREQIAALLRYIPRDRLLLETDGPHLAPVPYRGQTNTPLLIRETYATAAQMLGMDVASLAELVTANAKALFSIPQ